MSCPSMRDDNTYRSLNDQPFDALILEFLQSNENIDDKLVEALTPSRGTESRDKNSTSLDTTSLFRIKKVDLDIPPPEVL